MVYQIINLNNKKELQTNKKIIVLFTMKECPFCKLLHEGVWKLIKSKNYKEIQIFEIERSLLNKDIKEKISGFPTIAILQSGKLIETFKKERTFKNLDKFILSIK